MTSNGTMTNGHRDSESCESGGGFWICIVSVAADCTSDGLSAVLHVVALGHVVARADTVDEN